MKMKVTVAIHASGVAIGGFCFVSLKKIETVDSSS
jgi:hypothetical protein